MCVLTQLLCKDSSFVGSDIGNYRQLKCEYLPYICVYMQALTVNCVDRLNTEGGRDLASRLTQIADKRRE